MSKGNLLEKIPFRLAVEIGRFEDNARVAFPRFRSFPGRLFGRLFRASSTIKLTLDPKCTAVWDLIDGHRTVDDIALRLKKRFGDEIEPLYERLGELLSILESNRMIKYH